MNLSDLHDLTDQILESTQSRSRLAGEFDPRRLALERLSTAPYLPERTYRPGTAILRYTAEFGAEFGEYEQFVQRLRTLAGSPPVYRLNHVKQLSTAFFGSAISAGHSRLEHVLGAFDVAVRLFRAADRYMRDHSDGVDLYAHQRRNIIRAGLLVAFFHDVFHPPFGHAFDPLRPVLFPSAASMRIDKTVLVLEMEKASQLQGVIYDLLSRFVFFDCEDQYQPVVELALEFLGPALADSPEIPENLKEVAFVLDILNSRIDHDRLDYLYRDAAHVLQDTRHSLASFLGEFDFHTVDGAVRLVYSADITNDLRELLRLRRVLYSRVYEAREKAATDEMLRHAVEYLFQAHGLLRARLALPEQQAIQGFGASFARLSDHALVRLINEAEDGPQVHVAKKLIQDLFTGAFFVPVEGAHHEVPNEYLLVLERRYAALRRKFTGALKSARTPAMMGLNPTSEKIAEVYQQALAFRRSPVQVPVDELSGLEGAVREELLQNAPLDTSGAQSALVELQALPVEDLYWVLQFFGSDSRLRLSLEEFLWLDIQERWSGFEHWLSTTVADVDDAEEAKSLKEAFKETPLVFLAMSKPGSADFYGQLLMEASREREILVWDKRLDEVTTLGPEKAEGGRVNNFWLTALKPQSMPDSADSAIAEAVKSLILEDGWTAALIHWSAE